MPRLGPWLVEAHRADVQARVLSQWPQDRPEDLMPIQRFAEWLNTLSEPAMIQHPFFR
ncbi:hypothetical protein [Halopseudomonas pelagia]|uniref:hypothetical protein n=1 Tax=Halopseudomonas pelagia TaxID=553151 RepID=UPI0003B3723F|nr:hypothetical protein [Halopseudomonas pelagia]